jgi:outer membrane autotransporter protein
MPEQLFPEFPAVHEKSLRKFNLRWQSSSQILRRAIEVVMQSTLCRSALLHQSRRCAPLFGALVVVIISRPAFAACTNITTGVAVTASTGQPAAGEAVVCDTSVPNPTPSSTIITATGGNVTVTVQGGSQIRSTGRAIGVLSNSMITNMGAITTTGLNAFGISSLPGSDTVSLINQGTITTTGSAGHGLDARGTNTTITNTGTVTVSGAGAAGIRIAAGANNAVITNSGNVTGTVGALLQANGGTLTNTGTLTGTTGTAISLAGNNNILKLGTGSVIIGDVISTGTGNALVLTGSGTEDKNFAGFSKLTADQSTGTWTLTGNVGTVSGTASATNIQGGTLVVTGVITNSNDGGATIATGSALMLGNGGTTGTVTGAVDDEGVLNFNRSDSVAFAGAISGSGAVVQAGTGVTTLTATNTYIGGTIISTGTLALTGMGSIAASRGVENAGVFDISGTAAGASIKSLSGGGMVNLGAQSLTLTAASGTYSGVIQGSGGLTVEGGTQTLTGANSYTGATTITAGTLQVAGGGQVNGTAAVSVDAGGLIVTSAGTAFVTPGDLIMGRGAGAAVVTVADGGKLTTGRSFIGEGIGGTTLATMLTATVTGTGSVWDAGDFLGVGAVGGATTGTLTVSGGGVVKAQSNVSDSGIGIGGIGVVRVSGAGSAINIGGAAPFTIGELAGGAGTLTIENGGLVIAPTVLMGAFDATAGGTLNVNGTPGAQGVLQTAGLSKDSGSAGVNFDGGLLRATADNTAFISGFAPGEIILQAGGMTVDTGAFTDTAASTLAGSGALTKQGVGTLIVTADNSYAGDTTITAGALELGNGGTTGGIVGDVTDNGMLTFDRSDDLIFAGVISGMGAVSQVGTGTIVLSGANGYAGGTTISGGTLVGSSSSFGSGAILDNAVLVIDQPMDADFANALNGTGRFIKQGAGRLNLIGTGTYSGMTIVTAGTLSVNGAIAASAVTVANGATLGGNGTVGATMVQSGATIAPGNSIGTLHVNGAFVQAAGSLYQVELDPASSASDLVLVNGTASIAGGAMLSIAQNPIGDYRPNTRYTVLTASGGVSGRYDLAGDTAVSEYLALQETQDANNIYLSVIQTGDLAVAAQTSDQAAVANGVASAPPDNSAQTAVLNSQSDAATRSAFDVLSGEVQASARGALVSGSLPVRDTAFDRLRDLFCATSGSEGRHRPGCVTDRPAIWIRGFGNWGHMSGSTDAAGISQSTGGFLVGVDVPVDDVSRVGVFGGYSRTDFDVSARASSGNSNNYHLGTYGGTQWGGLGLKLGASYSWNAVATGRAVVIDDFTNNLQARYNAGTTQVFGELEQVLAADQVSLKPFVNLAYVNLRTGGFSETGGDAALTSRANTMEDTFSTLGVRPSTMVTWVGIDATLRGMLGWRHTFGDVTPGADVSFAGGSIFTVTGAPIARNAGVVEAGMDFDIVHDVAFGFTYGGQFSGRETNHSIRGAVAVTF